MLFFASVEINLHFPILTSYLKREGEMYTSIYAAHIFLVKSGPQKLFMVSASYIEKLQEPLMCNKQSFLIN